MVFSCIKNFFALIFPKRAGHEPAPAAEARPQPVLDSTPIAIIGAGIGGLAFAIGCIKNNVSFTLYESAKEYSTIGAGVGLGPNALRAMDMIDPALRAMYNKISSGNLTPGKEHVMMEVLYAEDGFGEKRNPPWVPAPFGADCYERTSAHRRDLLNILTTTIPRDMVRFRKRVTDISQLSDKVVISFDDGEVAEHLAVVGADGVKGPTRQFVLGDKYPDKVRAKFSGKYVYRSIIPMEDALQILGHHAGDSKSFIGHDVNFITFPISRGTQCNVVAFKHVHTPWIHDQWTKRVTKEEMVADYANGVDKRLVKLLDWADPLQWSLHHHMDTPTYYNGLICLLGDSAHATTPHQASGAGQCIEDALILSALLGKVKRPKHLPLAFHVYDSIRRPRAQKVVRTSQEAGQVYSFTHPETGEDMAKIAENLNQRFLWIWEHDLEGDIKKATEELQKLMSEGG
ncbi:mannitol 1-phosphate dehydrogenase [Thozetella sp. PMI_491]|nr:mannitol 1-phosphate dehydrogenase [Thozetella sp. PMI_491]